MTMTEKLPRHSYGTHEKTYFWRTRSCQVESMVVEFRIVNVVSTNRKGNISCFDLGGNFVTPSKALMMKIRYL